MIYMYGHYNESEKKYDFGLNTEINKQYLLGKGIITLSQYYSAVDLGEGLQGNPVSFWSTTNNTTMYGYRAVNHSNFAGTAATGYYCFPLINGVNNYSYSLYGKISSYDNESGTHIYGDAIYSGSFDSSGLTTTLFGGSGSAGSTNWQSFCTAYISDTLTFEYESNINLGQDMQIFKFLQRLVADDDVGWSEIDIQNFNIQINN